MESFWLIFTAFGSDLVFIAALALYGWLVRPGRLRALGVAFALSYLLNSLLKYGLNLPRPFTNDPGVASTLARSTAGGPGLPSGHAQMSATLWGGIAAQVRRPWVWGVLGLLVALVSYSRLALHVHYPSDVIVGLLLGVLFAALATLDWRRTSLLAPNIWLPVVVLVIACLLPTRLPDEYSRGLGMLAGFWLAEPRYLPPTTWAGRIGVAVIGLVLVIGVYLGLSALAGLLTTALSGAARALRYFLLVMVAVWGVPALLGGWLRPLPTRVINAES